MECFFFLNTLYVYMLMASLITPSFSILFFTLVSFGSGNKIDVYEFALCAMPD